MKIELFHGDSLLSLLVDSTANDSSESLTLNIGQYSFFGQDSLYRLRISNIADTLTSDFSDYFKLSTRQGTSTYGNFLVNAPAAGVSIRVGDSLTITWSSQYTDGFNSTDLYLMKGNTVVRTIIRTEDDGTYTWIPDADLQTGHDYRIYYDHEMYAFGTTKSAYFTIVGAASGNQ